MGADGHVGYSDKLTENGSITDLFIIASESDRDGLFFPSDI